MLLVPALTLWVLAAIRLPAIADPNRASLFRATLFAAAACTLYIPQVYNTVDPVLGGHNVVGLTMLLFLLAGFWQFRTATLLAILSNNARRRRRLAFGGAAMAAAGLAATIGFLTSRVDRTDQNLPLSYGDQPGMQVFLWTGSAFIIWVCVDIAMVCRQHVASMQAATFRAAFKLIGLGCAAFCLVLTDRLLYGALVATHAEQGAVTPMLDVLYSLGESAAVVLVSLGLVLPRLIGPARRLRRNLRARWLLLVIQPTWRCATAGTQNIVLNPHAMPLLDIVAGQPVRRLHRRVIEIRDCEFKRPDRPLPFRSIELVRHIEDVLTNR